MMLMMVTVSMIVLCVAASHVTADHQQTKCPALTARTGQHLVCHYNNDDVNCTTPLQSGTIATVTCKPSYVVTSEPERMTASTCRSDGTWSQALALCTLNVMSHEGECGRQSQREMVLHGETVRAGGQPWSVFIHFRRSGTTEWGYISTGTLITPTHIITAAGYVTNSDGQARPAATMRLTAGHQFYDVILVEPDQQTRAVMAIVLHEQYEYTSRVHDLALLVADIRFEVTWAVNVACVDWSNQLPALIPSDVLIVASWKQGSSKTSQLVLAIQNTSLVPRQQCIQSTEPGRRHYITAEKFCAQPINNDTCKDYEGAGMLVEWNITKDARFYLRGVRSVRLADRWSGECLVNRLQGFTDLAQYITWIQQIVRPPV